MSRDEVLIEGVADALNVLAGRSCPDPACDGCLYEHGEVRVLLTAALAVDRGEQCPRCDGERSLPPPPRSERDFSCPLCEASGTRAGFVAVRPEREHVPSTPLAEGVEDALGVLTQSSDTDLDGRKRDRDEARTMLQDLLARQAPAEIL